MYLFYTCISIGLFFNQIFFNNFQLVQREGSTEGRSPNKIIKNDCYTCLLNNHKNEVEKLYIYTTGWNI